VTRDEKENDNYNGRKGKCINVYITDYYLTLEGFVPERDRIADMRIE